MVEEENKQNDEEQVENLQQLIPAEDEPIANNEPRLECPVCTGDIQHGDGPRLRNCLHMICEWGHTVPIS